MTAPATLRDLFNLRPYRARLSTQLVGLAQFLPALLLTLPAGHVADRWHRARILLASIVLQGAVALLLVAASHGAWISRELLLALSVLLGVAKAFQMPASQALPALLVPPELLPRAVALGSSGMQMAIIAGPALGGFVYVAGAAVVYGLCGAFLLLGALLAAGIRHAAPAAQREPVSWASGLGPIGSVLLGGVGVLLVAALWVRWFPSLWQRERLLRHDPLVS